MSLTDRLRCDIPSDWINDASQCLFEWQGLAGGMLAVGAALLGAIFLWLQIRQSASHRENDIARRHTAAKLTMPLALSGVSEIVQKIANEIASELETFAPDGFSRTFDAILADTAFRKRFEPAVLPPDVIGAFENFAETLSNKSDIKHVSELMANIQIMVSRFNDLDLQGAGVKSNLESLLLDAVTVKILNDGIFNYARDVEDSSFGIVGVIPNGDVWELIRGVAQGLVFLRQSPDHFFPAINEIVDRSLASGTSPWLEKFGK